MPNPEHLKLSDFIAALIARLPHESLTSLSWKDLTQTYRRRARAKGAVLGGTASVISIALLDKFVANRNLPWEFYLIVTLYNAALLLVVTRRISFDGERFPSRHGPTFLTIEVDSSSGMSTALLERFSPWQYAGTVALSITRESVFLAVGPSIYRFYVPNPGLAGLGEITELAPGIRIVL